MKNTQKEFQVQQRHMIALAAILWRAPVLPLFLKKWDFEFDKNDQAFINGYIKYGMLVIWSLILAGLSWYLSGALGIDSLFWMFWLFVVIWFVLIFSGVFMVFSDKFVFQKLDYKPEYKSISSWNIDLVLNYLPVYNFFIWEYGSDDIESYWWLKESILFWSLWTVFALFGFQNLGLMMFMVIVLVLRVITLLAGMDFLPDEYKAKLDALFDKNIEEVYGYVKGSILYLISKVKHKGVVSKSVFSLIETSKSTYKTRYSIVDNYELRIQYIILIFIIGGFFNQLWAYTYNMYVNFYIMWLAIWVGRYLIYIKDQKLPKLPVLDDLSVYVLRWVKYIIDLFK